MRLAIQSSRTTLRALTTILAATALLLTMAAPFSGIAHADEHDPPEGAQHAFAGFLLLSNGDNIFIGDPNDPATWTYSIEHPQDVVFEGYEWQEPANPPGAFHLSCSANLVGTNVRVDGGDIVQIVDFAIHRENAKHASAPLSENCLASTFTDLEIAKTTASETVTPDSTFTYTLTVTNVASGGSATTAVNVVMEDQVPAPFVVTSAGDPKCSFPEGSNTVTCDVGSLAKDGGSFSTTITVAVPADADCGDTTNVATAAGTNAAPARSNEVDVPIVDCFTAAPSIELIKTASPTTFSTVGQVIGYSFLVTNDGNVPLTGIVLDDPLLTDVSCPETSLAPGEDMTCTGSYTITQADRNVGEVPNTATVGGTAPDDTTVTHDDSVTVRYVLPIVTDIPEGEDEAPPAVLDGAEEADDTPPAPEDDPVEPVDDSLGVLDGVVEADDAPVAVADDAIELDELPATGLETAHLILLALLFAALGALLLLSSRTRAVPVGRDTRPVGPAPAPNDDASPRETSAAMLTDRLRYAHHVEAFGYLDDDATPYGRRE